MKKLLLTSIAVVCAMLLSSQVWCPPGATWNYRIKTGIGGGQGNYDGYLTVMSTGTTVIAGKTCTIIGGNWTGTYGWPGSFPLNGPQSVTTYFQNDVVYYYEYTKGKFDTLMD